MFEPAGRWLRLSPHRVMIADLMHFSRKLPSIPVQRRMQIAAVVAAREKAVPRPSWCTIFTKAFAIVAHERPELRRSYVTLPWKHLYEAFESTASVAVEQGEGAERTLNFAKLPSPNKHRLGAIDRYIKRVARSTGTGNFMAHLGRVISHLPWPIRRILWWYALNAEGKFRTRQFGTYGVSVYSGTGSESLHPLSPLTFLINYGVIDESGEVNVRLVYDHRVLDGADVARALAEIEKALTGPILEELRSLDADLQSPILRPLNLQSRS